MGKATEGDAVFSQCSGVAQVEVARLSQLAKTQHERLQYADLHNFLLELEEYHQIITENANASDIRERQARLNKFRGRLEETFSQ